MVWAAQLMIAGLLTLSPGAVFAQILDAPKLDALRLDAATPMLWAPIPTFGAPSPHPRTEGLGLFATSRERSINFAALTGGIGDGPAGTPFGTAAGLGWRKNNVSAMFGYMRPELTKTDWRHSDVPVTNFQERAHMGFGLALHF